MEHLGQFIINHWQLWLAFIVILLLTFINELITQKKKAKEITPQVAVDLINNENAVVVDLRDKEAFTQGHIIDSIHAKSEEFEQKKMDKYKNKPIILVATRAIDAQTLASKIRGQGYQPHVLGGGIAAWQNADLPLVKGK
ncbi:rhodanese-like domain-containing protein [Fluoribacter dumoffii]|uniref:Thiosulfate sulfurtransferase n=1 Tax=Fluoribacter dumoffii TaxID=463 RepID=A0A377G6T6_9GAMM|nr:rhodanese-like domain-containing protein [Fluoribacter dumoffii]KTC89407.1 rhodanese-related sulfurtransferase [Fluoribacter dumoffii NY 23]MCW8386796.1 rhodanese-like domain-containing protein [Fluoribacter dumoffii]MCW8417669.1 rhodanese-like domain-containing protein [Fluoribacter dumoffii]MCW8454489.1 rhodanese-like domain-containing protein [Fluoribacter dumoffii]MCW8461437.1 rhodanese-like domain-containing protein [Fluoribacter dumoffii]